MFKPTTAVLAAIMLSTASFDTHAAQFGLGAGVTSNEGGTIFLPIDSGKLRIEPELSFSFNDNDSTYQNNSFYNSSYKTSFVSVGTGIYLLLNTSDSLQSYVGSSVGYIHSESEAEYPNASYSNSKLTANGFYIAPTFGTEYFFSKNFSIGLDLSLQYSNLSGKENAGTSSQTSTDNKSFDTRTRTMLRYYFR